MTTESTTPSTSSTPSAASSAPASAPQNNPSSSGYNPFAPRTNSTPPASQPAETEHSTPPTQQPATQQPPVQQQQTLGTAASPIVPLTQEQFQQTLQSVLQQNRQPAAPQTQPQLSEQEFRQKFNIFSVTPETYESIFGVAPSDPRQVAALDMALQGVAKQAVTMARFLMEQQFGEMRSSLAPLHEAHAAQREAQLKQTFFTKHADLKDYEPLVREVTLAMQKEGHQFQSPEQAMEQVAARSRHILQNMKVVPGAAQSPAAGANPVAQRMAPLSTGGRSGSSAGGSAPQTTAAKLFGNMKR